MYITSNKYVIDSLNYVPKWKEGLKFNSKKPITLSINKDILYCIIRSKDSSGKQINSLIKLKMEK